MIGRPKFVLASGSPRRLALINQAGIEPDALPPADIDETPKRGELPRACANRLARGKAEAALAAVKLDDELNGAYILAADTVVAVGRRILPKAELLDEAAQCLRLLSGRNHRVYTAICLVTPKEAFRQRLVETRVRFKRLSDEDIEAYLASGEWRGKAGGYAAQGLAGTFIVKMVGSYTNVVGLPLYETMTLLPARAFRSISAGSTRCERASRGDARHEAMRSLIGPFAERCALCARSRGSRRRRRPGTRVVRPTASWPRARRGSPARCAALRACARRPRRHRGQELAPTISKCSTPSGTPGSPRCRPTPSCTAPSSATSSSNPARGSALPPHGSTARSRRMRRRAWSG